MKHAFSAVFWMQPMISVLQAVYLILTYFVFWESFTTFYIVSKPFVNGLKFCPDFFCQFFIYPW